MSLSPRKALARNNKLTNTDDRARRAGEAFARLTQLAARLRAPDGCPWDREQTVASSTPYILEEAYEAVDALEARDWDEAREELGDLLFQVVFQAQIAVDKNRFDASEVIEAVEAKMIRRHPHVFGDAKAETADEVLKRWGEIKRDERGGRVGLLRSVPKSTAALTRAQRLGKKAANVGFDWPDAAGVMQKICEEVNELEAARDHAEAERELGDLLFALAQWARHRKLDSESALRRACSRFQSRFECMETMADCAETDLSQLDMEQLDNLWEEAKDREKLGKGCGNK